MEMNLIETINKFPDQGTCVKYLERLRWQEEPTCPYCGGKRSSKRAATYRHQCHECNKSYSVLVGTIFEDTNLPLPKWFLAISLILNAKKGLSAPFSLPGIWGSIAKQAGICRCVSAKRCRKIRTKTCLTG